MVKYTLNPTTLKDLKDNARFQYENLQGFMESESYEYALIKARCLIESLEELLGKIGEGQKQEVLVANS